MANQVEIQITADPKHAQAGFKSTQTAFGKMADGIKRHRKAIGIGLSAIGAGITALGVSAVKSAQDEAIGIAQLDQALQNVGTSYDAQAAAIEKVIAAQQNKTNFGDEAQRGALMGLISVSGDYESAMSALPAVLDLAAGKSMDLGAASTLVARAISGETSALKRYGIEVEKGAGSTEVITAIMAKFGGQAEAAADPMVQLKNRVGDLQQEFGKALLPALTPMAGILEKVTTKLIAWTDAHPKLTKLIVVLVAALGGLAIVLGPILLALPAIAAGMTLLLGPVGLVVLAIAGLTAGVVLLVKHWDTVGPTVTKVADNVINVLNKMTWVVREAFALMLEGVQFFAEKLGKKGLAKGLQVAIDTLRRGIPSFEEITTKIADLGFASEETAEKVEETAEKVEETAEKVVGAFKDIADASQEGVEIVTAAEAQKAAKIRETEERLARDLKAFQEQQFEDLVESTRKQLKAEENARASRLQKYREEVDRKIALKEKEKAAYQKAIDDMIRADQRQRESINETLKRWSFAQSEAFKLKLNIENVGQAFIAMGGSGIQAQRALIAVGGATGSVEAFMAALGITATEARHLVDQLESSLRVLERKASAPLAQQRFNQVVAQRREVQQQTLRAAQRAFDRGHHREGERLTAISDEMRRVIHEATQRFSRGQSTPGFKEGGTVPGPRGAPVLATVHGGETIIPAGRGAGMTINLVINGDVNGFDDFQAKVTAVVRDAVLGGGFQGVLARA